MIKIISNWKTDFEYFEQISGSPGEIGSVMYLVYSKFILFETIVSKKFPFEYEATYEYKRGTKTQMFYRAINTFKSLGLDKTSISLNLEIFKVNGFFLKNR